jgi:hypothetical protein
LPNGGDREAEKTFDFMKNKLINCIYVIFLSVILYGCGTMMGAKASEEARRFEKIIDIPNLSKSEIYIKANAWFVETFNSAESVIEFQDKEAGKIMGKYTYKYDEGVCTYMVRQTISIDIRENKIRFIINDPYFKRTSCLGEVFNESYSPLVTQKGTNKAWVVWEKTSNSLVDYLKNDDSW